VTDHNSDAPPERFVGATAAAAAIGMFVLGSIRIGRSFGYDEGYTYHFFINGGSVRRALTTQIVFNNHPTFSAVQALAWRLGLVGETAQRLGPVVCAALTVGLVVWRTTQRCGVHGGLAAGVVLALNPMYLDQARQLRGYALATLGVVVVSLAVERSCADHRRRWLIVQGIAMVVAVTTHAYSAVPVLMIAAATLGAGRLRRAHIATWLLAATVAFVMQIPLLDETRVSTRSRGTLFRPDFPVELGRALLGVEWFAVCVVGALTILGAWAVARGPDRRAAAVGAAVVPLVIAVALVWAVGQPRDLYPRFFVSVIPLIAYVAGHGVAVLPRVAEPLAVVVVGVALAGGVGGIVGHRPAIRDAAAVADRARANGLTLCGLHAEPVFVYTPPFRLVDGVHGVDDVGDCEVFISLLGMSSDQRDTADRRFDARRGLGGTVIVWADPAVIDVVVPTPD
jgi:hypothetical protein